MSAGMDVVVIGLAVTSSWGNGHATTYRALLKGLAGRGHRVAFLERDVPWYAEHRDLPSSPYWDTLLYGGLEALRAEHAARVRAADLVVVGSYVPDGAAIVDWVLAEARGVRAFYDIDTPVTLAALARGACDYLRVDQIAGFDLMLSFTGGPTLARLESEYGARRARALYCSVDVEQHRPTATRPEIDLGYMGTYSADRQPALDALLNEPARRLPARRFVVAGAQYPAQLRWPANVVRIEHLPPSQHAAFYARQRYTLNLTRADMRAAGWSPSVRLFEAAACGVPIVSDAWDGIEDVLVPGREILVAQHTRDVLEILDGTPDAERVRIAAAAQTRVRAAHSGDARAAQLEAYVAEVAAEAAGTRADEDVPLVRGDAVRAPGAASCVVAG